MVTLPGAPEGMEGQWSLGSGYVDRIQHEADAVGSRMACPGWSHVTPPSTPEWAWWQQGGSRGRGS